MPRSAVTTRTASSRRRASAGFASSVRLISTAQRIALDANNHIVSTSPFAASVWFNYEDSVVSAPVSNVRAIFSAKSDLGVGFTLYVYGMGSSVNPPFLIGPGATGTFQRSRVATASEASARDKLAHGWHMYTVVFDGVDYAALSSYSLYIDDVPYGLISSSTTVTSANGNTIGNLSSGNLGVALGSIAKYRVWQGGSSMTADQVAELYYEDTLPSGPTLIREYLFTEGLGTSLADTSGNGMNGTMTAGTPWSAKVPSLPRVALRPMSNSLSFDGSGDGVSMGNNFSHERTDPVSYSAWIYKNTQGANGYIITKADSAENGFSLKMTYDGLGGNKFIVKLSNADATNNVRIDSVLNIIPVNSWHHVCVTYDGSSKVSGTHLYLDGQLLPNASSTDTLSATIVNTAPFCVGAYNGTTGSWKGNITNVRIYSAELTAAQVADEYYNGRIVSGSVQGEWLMTDGAGSTLTASVGGINGTITGAAWASNVPFKDRTVAT